MKLTDLTVAQLALAAARVDVVCAQDTVLKSELQLVLNDLVWNSHWRRNEAAHVNFEKAHVDSILAVFKACREYRPSENEQPALVRAVVHYGDLKGWFLYDPITACLVFRPEFKHQYQVFFCHPEAEEIHILDGANAQQPFDFLPIDSKLYELSSVKPNI